MDFDGLPDESQASAPPSFDAMPDESKQDATPAAPTFMGTMESSVTAAPKAIYQAGKSALSDLWQNEQQNASTNAANPSNLLTDWIGTGGKMANVAAAPMAPVSNVAKAGAQAIAEPLTSAIQGAGTLAAHAVNANPTLPSREDVYSQVEPDVETALGLATPRANPLRGAVPVPPRPTTGPLGVTLSEGQATGVLPAIQREQAALRGTSGASAQERAQQFADQQKSQLATARESVVAGLDPFGQNIAASPNDAGDLVSTALGGVENQRKGLVEQERAALVPANTINPLDAADTVAQSLRGSADTLAQTQAQNIERLQTQHENIRSSLNPAGGAVLANGPQDAAEIISGGVTRAEEQARAARDAAYGNFRNQQGTFNPKAFSNISNTIKRSLNLGDDPVILNDKTTPMASAALQDVDSVVGAPAREALSPDTTSYKPFTPETIDDARKRLVAFSRQANASARATNDFSDVRAMRRITDAFDETTQAALRNPSLFSGDGDAVADAIGAARGLHADLRNAFSRQGSGDKVGPIMQQIIGQREGQAAPANQIAQWLYGNGQTPVLIGRRMLSVFGPQSPEVAAIKQGLFSHVTERPDGVTAWSPEQAADKIHDFVNGRGRALAQTYFSPSEQNALRAHAEDLRASITPPPPPTDVVSRALNKINGVGGQGATSAELADTLFGRSGLGDNPLGVKLAQHVRDTYGVESEPFEAIRQGMFSRLTRAESGRLGFDPEAIADQIDAFLSDRGRPMADTLYSPDDQTQLKAYADALRDHAQRAAEPDNEVDRAIGRIGGRDGPPATAREVADLLYSRSVARDRGLSVNLSRRLKDQFGESSPQWSAIKQGLFRQLVEPGEGLTDWGPGKVAQRLNKFLNVDGVEMSQAIFNPNERAMLQNYADLMRKLEVPQAGANWSNTATFMAKTMNNLGGKVGMVTGAALGRAALPFAPPLVAEGMGAAAAAGAGKAAQAIQARAVAKQLPLVGQQIQQWQKAVARAQKLNTPPSRVAATTATLNLSRALQPLGISLQQIAGSGTGAAYGAPGQQNVPGPVQQQKTGGEVDQKAQGGAVETRHEPSIKARKGDLARAVAIKSTKTNAHYRGGSKAKRCALCSMFEPPNGCRAVRGQISPRGLCDFYEAKAKQKELDHAA